jgi:hypothetical protein
MQKRTILVLLMLIATGVSTAAQTPVTDVANTLRNAATAATKEMLVRLQQDQHSQLRRMAHRLSNFTRLDKYAVPGTPLWRIHDFENEDLFLYSRPYHAALNYGDAMGSAHGQVTRARHAATQVLASLPPQMRDAVMDMLATIDLADSTLISATDQSGRLRYNGRRELAAITALERHVIDPSNLQSATAISDKISGAALIAARQRQARLQLLNAITEQLVIDTKRARDSDTVVMNMQLAALASTRGADRALFAGAANALRNWRQP